MQFLTISNTASLKWRAEELGESSHKDLPREERKRRTYTHAKDSIGADTFDTKQSRRKEETRRMEFLIMARYRYRSATTPMFGQFPLSVS